MSAWEARRRRKHGSKAGGTAAAGGARGTASRESDTERNRVHATQSRTQVRLQQPRRRQRAPNHRSRPRAPRWSAKRRPSAERPSERRSATPNLSMEVTTQTQDCSVLTHRRSNACAWGNCDDHNEKSEGRARCLRDVATSAADVQPRRGISSAWQWVLKPRLRDNATSRVRAQPACARDLVERACAGRTNSDHECHGTGASSGEVGLSASGDGQRECRERSAQGGLHTTTRGIAQSSRAQVALFRAPGS